MKLDRFETGMLIIFAGTLIFCVTWITVELVVMTTAWAVITRVVALFGGILIIVGSEILLHRDFLEHIGRETS